jgi:hypothetical protein
MYRQLAVVNELQIPWEKIVTVAGWQMVQTPNYIAPAIGAFFSFFYCWPLEL